MQTSKRTLLLSFVGLSLCLAWASGCTTTSRHHTNSSRSGATPTYVADAAAPVGGVGTSGQGGTSLAQSGGKATTQSLDMNETLRRQEEELERQRRELEELQQSPRESYSVPEQEAMQENDRLFDERGEDFARPY